MRPESQDARAVDRRQGEYWQLNSILVVIVVIVWLSEVYDAMSRVCQDYRSILLRLGYREVEPSTAQRPGVARNSDSSSLGSLWCGWLGGGETWRLLLLI